MLVGVKWLVVVLIYVLQMNDGVEIISHVMRNFYSYSWPTF